METVLTYLSDKAPGVFAIIIVGIIVWRVARFYFTRFKKTADSVAILDNKIMKLDNKMSILERTTENIRDVVIEMSEIMQNKKSKLPKTMLKKLSPYVLTDSGIKFLDISGGKDCVDSNLDFFISEIEAMQPQTAYDVESFSYRALYKNTGSPIFNGIKDFVYLSPDVIEVDGAEVSISLSSVVMAMSIYLRDMYFEKHPELNFRKDLNQ